MGIPVEQLKNGIPASGGVIYFQSPSAPQTEVVSFEGQSIGQVRTFLAQQTPTKEDDVLAEITGRSGQN